MSSGDVLMPRDGAKWVANQAKHVSILMDGVKKAADLIEKMLDKDNKTVEKKKWTDDILNPHVANHAAVDWIFLVDTLNFSFWSTDEPKFKINYLGQDWTGYWTLCAAINRALKNGTPITEPSFYASADLVIFSALFASEVGQAGGKTKPSKSSSSDSSARSVGVKKSSPTATSPRPKSPATTTTTTPVMPMLRERVACCNEVGRILNKKFGGTFLTMLTACNRSAVQLVKNVVEEFQCYRDVSTYKGKQGRVHSKYCCVTYSFRQMALYKRAQILVADIWACFEGQGLGEFHDIDQLTIFADYRIPQVLVWLNAMEYSKDLNLMLKQDKLLKNGDEREVEIRACSIHAIELILAEVRGRGKKVNAVEIDHFLWEYRRQHPVETAVVPYHKVRCIYY